MVAKQCANCPKCTDSLLKSFLLCDSVATNLSPQPDPQAYSHPKLRFPSKPLRSPFAADPAISHFLTALGLIERHHMPSSVDSHERQVARALHLSNLPPVLAKCQFGEINLIVGLLSSPIETFGPCIISEPVADEIRVTLSHR